MGFSPGATAPPFCPAVAKCMSAGILSAWRATRWPRPFYFVAQMESENSGTCPNLRFDDYVSRQIDREFEGKQKQDIADILGISTEALRLWNKRVDWEMVKAERRKRFAPDISEIDQAVMRSAKKGDVRAAELAYQRFDGWVPKSEQEVKETSRMILNFPKSDDKPEPPNA